MEAAKCVGKKGIKLRAEQTGRRISNTELTNRMCLKTLDEQNGTSIGLKQSMTVFLLVADDRMAVFIVLVLSPSALKTHVIDAFEHQVV